MLDVHRAVNASSAILLAQALAAWRDRRPGGRIVFMTSGRAWTEHGVAAAGRR